MYWARIFTAKTWEEMPYENAVEEERSAVMLEMLTQFDEKNYEEGLREEEKLVDIRNLMSTMKWSAEQAMQALKIPEADRPKYSAKL